MIDHHNVELTVRAMLAKLLSVDESRITVLVRPDGQDEHGEACSRMTLLIDGAEPAGRHRDLIVQWARRTGGKLVGAA